MTWYSFGRGELGSLGRPLERRKFAHIYEPTPQPVSTQLERLSAGFAHCVAWQNTKCFSWGLNGECQLGIHDPGGQNARTIVEQPAPVIGLPADERITQAAAGRIMTVVLTQHADSKKQRLFLFGHIDQNFDPGEHDMQEIPLPGDLEVSQIHCLSRSVLLRTVSENIWELKHDVPLRPFPGVTHVSKLCTGAYHVLAICLNRMLYSWGNGAFGQLGQGACKNCPAPVPVSWANPATAEEKPPRVKLIACGENFSLCYTQHGKVFSWGSNEFKQLGSQVLHGVSTPRPIKVSMVQVDSIKAGRFHACLLSEGKLYTWGLGSYGQLGYDLDPQLGANVPFGEPSCPSLRTQQFPRLVIGPWQKVIDVECGAYQTFVKAVGENPAFDDGRKQRHSMLRRLSLSAVPPEDEVMWPSKSKELRDTTNNGVWSVLQETRSVWTSMVSSMTHLFATTDRKHHRMRSQKVSLMKPIMSLKEDQNSVVVEKQLAYSVHPLERPPPTKQKQKRRALERVRAFAISPFSWDGWDETVDRILGEGRHSVAEFLSPDEVTEWNMLARIQRKGFIGPFSEIIRSAVVSPVPVTRKERLFVYAAPGAECFYDPHEVTPRHDSAADPGSPVRPPRKLQKNITVEAIIAPRSSAPSLPSVTSGSSSPRCSASGVMLPCSILRASEVDLAGGNVEGISPLEDAQDKNIDIPSLVAVEAELRSRMPSEGDGWMRIPRGFSASFPVMWSQEDERVNTIVTCAEGEDRHSLTTPDMGGRITAATCRSRKSNIVTSALSPESSVRPQQKSGMSSEGRKKEEFSAPSRRKSETLNEGRKMEVFSAPSRRKSETLSERRKKEEFSAPSRRKPETLSADRKQEVVPAPSQRKPETDLTEQPDTTVLLPKGKGSVSPRRKSDASYDTSAKDRRDTRLVQREASAASDSLPPVQHIIVSSAHQAGRKKKKKRATRGSSCDPSKKTK